MLRTLIQNIKLSNNKQTFSTLLKNYLALYFSFHKCHIQSNTVYGYCSIANISQCYTNLQTTDADVFRRVRRQRTFFRQKRSTALACG